MDCERIFYQNRIPEWPETLVYYSELQKLLLIKASPGDILDSICTAICSIDAYYKNKYTIIHRKSKTRGCIPYRIFSTQLQLGLSHAQSGFDGLDSINLRHIYFSFLELRIDLEKLHWYGVLNVTVLRMVLRHVQPLQPDGLILDHALAILGNAAFAVQIECQKELETLHCLIDVVAEQLEELNAEGSLSVLARIAKTLGSDSRPLDTERLSLLIYEAIIDLGRRKLFASSPMSKSQNLKGHDEASLVEILCDLLTKLPEDEKCALWSKDQDERYPIHYASEYGLVEVFGNILAVMISTGQSQEVCTEKKSSVLTEDEINELLRLSVVGGHVELLQEMLQTPGLCKQDRGPALGPLLILSLQLEQHDSACLLVESGADTNYLSSSEESPLYLAARSGNEAITLLLLERQARTTYFERIQGRTPLIAAAIEGHLGTVKLLLQFGADTRILDVCNWSAADHAGNRGHLELAQLLRSRELEKQLAVAIEPKLMPPNLLPRNEQTCFRARQSSVLQDHCMVLVHLGSWDLHKAAPVLTLSPELSSAAFSISHPNSGFLIGVSIIDGTGPTVLVPLPILEDTTNSPLIFSTSNPTGFKFRFKLFRSDISGGTRQQVLLGSGIALPTSLKQCLGEDRESLIRDYNVPVLGTEDLQYIATITFSFLLITPFSHQLANVPISTRDLWNKNGPTKVIGHRGMGQNTILPKYPQIGENTLQSYLTAVNLGAAYTELDVQLTKDHVPVIYHDFLVSETGTDSPMHTLTLDQFMHISHSQSYSAYLNQPSSDDSSQDSRASSHNRGRASSCSKSDDTHMRAAFRERIKHTWDFQNTGYKGNTRGDYIHQPFTTLAEVLKKLPPSMPLDIELKYPMLWEATDWYKIDLYAVEANLFVDTVLTCIFKHASNRPIVLCSFSPEICILLALKQARYPIILGNDSGNYPTGDIRASNVQEAIRFANRWNLDGLALASEPLVAAPNLIRVIQEHGLMCLSYGDLNDVPENAIVQADAGIDILLVNKIRLISTTLGTR